MVITEPADASAPIYIYNVSSSAGMCVSKMASRGRLNMKMSYQYRDPHVKDYKNPLHLDVVDRYLRRMGDKTIPDEAPPSLESFYPPSPIQIRKWRLIACVVMVTPWRLFASRLH